MGKLLDIHPSLVSRYEQNRRKIPKDLRKKFVAFCSSKIDWPAFILLADAHREAGDLSISTHPFRSTRPTRQK
jgi:hypothetical protein